MVAARWMVLLAATHTWPGWAIAVAIIGGALAELAHKRRRGEFA
jgi:hypothetical protein